MFGISDVDFMANGIKIIDGIAGAGKSSMIDKFFNDNNTEYVRFASTNRLARDASMRYNMDVKTIASGLFVNKGTYFYAEEKEVDCKNIVIDEILQSNHRVIQWCLNHADNHNIIITTDSRQLLSPDNEVLMQSEFWRLRCNPDVIYVNVEKTLRARNSKTEAIYNKLYNAANSLMLFDTNSLIETFPNHINYSDMEYNTHDAYITHDNATEDFIYKDKGLKTAQFLDLIPKGCIASRPPKDLAKYPILSQLEADTTHTRAYTQVMNIGTAVRFQGSEVNDDRKLYFILQPKSMVSARELYTVVTRMWDINSFVIVICDTPIKFELRYFNGKPVKTHKYLTINEEGNTVPLNTKEMSEMLSNYDTDEVYYDRDEVRSYKGGYKYIRKGIKREDTASNKVTAGSLARRDSKLHYSYMDEVYSILNDKNIYGLRCIHKPGAHLKDNYEIDVYSAHPTMMKFEKMPIDGLLISDHPHDDMLNFYVYKGSHFTTNSIITDDMKNYITEKEGTNVCEYLFSTPYTIGCKPGEWLFSKAHDTQESKKDIKSIHYGYYQKPYIKESIEGDCYVRYENHIYELLICQIFSQLLYYMMRLYDEINGTAVIIDAVDFPTYDDKILKKIHSILPNYIDFRVKHMYNRGSDTVTDVVYQTYAQLPSKKDKRNARRRELYKKKKEANKNG